MSYVLDPWRTGLASGDLAPVRELFAGVQVADRRGPTGIDAVADDAAVLLARADGVPVGIAWYHAGDPAEVLVRPAYRRRGIGTALVSAVLERGGRVWAHANLPPARALAQRLDLVGVRELWQLRRSPTGAWPVDLPVGVTIRTFVVGRDEEAFLEVNSRAFSWHPEQGRLSLAELRAEEQADWFDPDGFFLAVGRADVLGTVGRADGSDTVGRTDESSTVGRTDESGTVGRADGSDTVGRADGSDTVGRTDESSTVGRTDESSTVGRTDESSTVGRADESGTVGRTDESSTVGRADELGTVGGADVSGAVGRIDELGIVGRADVSDAVGGADVQGTAGRADGSDTVGRTDESSTVGRTDGSSTVDVAETVLGFHQTKVHPQDPTPPLDLPADAVLSVGPIGEVYVLGVDPRSPIRGLGGPLTAAGLNHLGRLGLSTVMLYVESDNEPALKLYRRFGFQHYQSDIVYARPPSG